MTRTVVVAGVGGIGGDIVRRFLKAGNHVVAVDLDPVPNLDLPTPLSSRLDTVAADLTIADEVERVFAHVQQDRRVDVLVHTVGIADRVDLLDMPVERFDRMLSVCTRSMFLCVQAAAKGMVANSTAGRIITISSIVANRMARGLGHYAAAKAGLDALTKSFALELASYGIAVNGVAPGTIRTRLNDYLEDNVEARTDRLGGIPVGRFGMPSDIADVVTWLAGEAPTYLTGTVVVCDGATSTMLPGGPLLAAR